MTRRIWKADADAEQEYEISEHEAADASPAYRFVVCERDTRRIVIEKRANGTSMYLTYKSERGANAALGRARLAIRDRALMVVDREAE
jgi:hypothetical protein